jgi:hypothetical protein
MTGYYLWWVDNDELVVGLDNGDGTYTAPAGSSLTIRVYGTKEYDELGNTTGSLSVEDTIPKAFQMAVVDGAISQGYLSPGKDKQMAVMFAQKFLHGIARAQEYASRERVSDNIRPKECNIFTVDVT